MNLNTIAIIGGTGPEGRGLAVRWARAGLRTIVGSRDEQRARLAAHELVERVGKGATIEGMENTAAVAAADVVVLTVPFEAQLATLKQIKGFFRENALLITTTVPLATAVGDRGTRTVGVWQGSASEQVADAVPPSVKVVAAFQNVSAALLNSGDPIDCDVLVCGDHPETKKSVFSLIEKIPGLRAVDAGKLENARIVEQITALLIGINIRYKLNFAGLRITGVGDRQ
jgi:NADPH-dependent F420 reductase